MTDIMDKVKYRSDFLFEIKPDGRGVIQITLPRFVLWELLAFPINRFITLEDRMTPLESADIYIPTEKRLGQTKLQYDIAIDTLIGAYDLAWHNYNHQLKFDIPHEIARMCLPTALYVTASIPMDSRRIMTLIELSDKKRKLPEPLNLSKEAEDVMDEIEHTFKMLYPEHHEIFVSISRKAEEN